MFALELDVAHAFRPVPDLTSLDIAAYAGNPALKIPILVDERGPLFGTENICRDLVRRSGAAGHVVLRGDVPDRIVANVEELTLHAMAAEVSLIMSKASDPDRPPPPKLVPSLTQCLDYLDQHVDAALAALPATRRVSFLEVALFCLVEHLPFRQVLDVSPWQRLAAFRERFAERASARATPFRFDAA